jgi:hypothetical protein
MRSIIGSTVARRAAVVAASAATIIWGTVCYADSWNTTTPYNPGWVGGSQTSQTWTEMVPGSFTSTDPNSSVPDSVSNSVAAQTNATLSGAPANPSGAAVWYDVTGASDGAFAAGTDAYSFSGSLTPTAVIPGSYLSNSVVNIVAEVQTTGSPLTGDLLVKYVNPQGTQTVNASSLANYQFTVPYNASGGTFMGSPITNADWLWQFTLPTGASSITLTFGSNTTTNNYPLSGGLQDINVMTQTVAAVPEPGSITLAAFGAAVVAATFWRRRRQSQRNAKTGRIAASVMSGVTAFG